LSLAASYTPNDHTLRIPPVTIRVSTDLPEVVEHIELFYGTQKFDPVSAKASFVDFDIAVLKGTGLRRIWRPQARFLLDGLEPFLPLPRAQSAPLLEWGLNWCMASRPMDYLTIHAAVVAKGADALILPGFPGAGKSTLCAALVFLDKWRLLSDELTLLDIERGTLHPHPRPINLKNRSIDIVADFPGARIGPRYHDTRKGTVALAAPPVESVKAAEEPAQCRWVVFPTYAPEEESWCEELSRAEAFALIAEQSFNKDRLGATGFHALCAMLDKARCYEIGYRSTEEALSQINDISKAGS
jgi:HprK-related kinase A